MRRALDWVHRNTIRDEGICINSLQKKAYPEVTGYFIPTLLAVKEEALAGSVCKISSEHPERGWIVERSDSRRASLYF